MKTLEKKTEVKFVKEATLSHSQVRILVNKGFTVCFVKVDEWDQEVYAVYA